MINAPAAYEDVRIDCKTCLNSNCLSYVDEADAEVSYSPADLPAERVKVTLSDETNGYEGSTLKVVILHGADIIPGGSVVIGLPPTNANYYQRLGAWREEDLITDANSLRVTAATA